jgi:hypothetical protein
VANGPCAPVRAIRPWWSTRPRISQKAARDIVYGAGFDNNIICVDEKEVFVVEQVADQLVQPPCKPRAPT